MSDSAYLRVAKTLLGAYPYSGWPDAPWLNKGDSDDDIERAKRLFGETEQANEPAIVAAIDAWLSGAEWSALTDIQSFLLGIRFDYCFQFLMEMHTPDRFIPDPAAADPDIARWVLLDWWKANGILRYFANRHYTTQ